ncbi:uncharacterized protein LOC130449627 [Diorhabda sublineata]|uniref:uncharacterized protein LOC130449627 n=1 Tax=Diorhabda sublineata TaxID=1163346 RepID=UPI0024E1678F|nr:uncharacterized protein LOC130449627 [Diorhabda sublineata]
MKFHYNNFFVYQLFLLPCRFKFFFQEYQVPMLIRINHVIADGLSAMNLFAHTFGENDVKLEESLKNIPKSPEWQKLPIFQFLQNLLYFYLVPGYLLVKNFRGELKSLTGQSYEGPMTSFRQNVSYGTEKPGEGLVQKIKSMKKQIGDTSFSEIILTAISASLYKYYQKALYKVPESISTAIVATKDLKPLTINGVPQLRNQFGIVPVQMPIKLHTHSILERLQGIKKFTRKLMKDPSELMISNFITFNLLKFLPTPLIKRLLPLKGYATVISNLPEFPKIVIFNGHVVEDAYFFTLQRDEMSTGFAVVSYDSRVHLGFVGDAASVPSIEDCDGIVSEFFNTFDLLQKEIDKKRSNPL